MKPSTEKMAKPARKLVMLFRRHRRKESLEGNRNKKTQLFKRHRKTQLEEVHVEKAL